MEFGFWYLNLFFENSGFWFLVFYFVRSDFILGFLEWDLDFEILGLEFRSLGIQVWDSVFGLEFGVWVLEY